MSVKIGQAPFLHPLGKTVPWPNGVRGVEPMALTYGSVNLAPSLSSLNSRSETDISVQFGPFKLKIPIISAPMDTIVGEEMIRQLFALGALGVAPRAVNHQGEATIQLCRRLKKDKVDCIYSVGLKDGLDLAKKLQKIGAKMVLLDIAHGGIKNAIATAIKIKKIGIEVMMGNIACYDQAKYYFDQGLKYARVGVGPGGLCTTRLVAGTGVGQLSAVLDTVQAGVTVIADGGIKHPGDFAKALAAGATVVMIGSMFAGTDEAPGEIIGDTKVARGQASASYMQDNGVSTGEFRAAEGIQTMVPRKGPVANVIYNLIGGLRSAMAYAGAKNIVDFRQRARFVLASSAVRAENRPHINN